MWTELELLVKRSLAAEKIANEIFGVVCVVTPPF
jgi:hypothetical protein